MTASVARREWWERAADSLDLVRKVSKEAAPAVGAYPSVRATVDPRIKTAAAAWNTATAGLRLKMGLGFNAARSSPGRPRAAEPPLCRPDCAMWSRPGCP